MTETIAKGEPLEPQPVTEAAAKLPAGIIQLGEGITMTDPDAIGVVLESYKSYWGDPSWRVDVLLYDYNRYGSDPEYNNFYHINVSGDTLEAGLRKELGRFEYKSAHVIVSAFEERDATVEKIFPAGSPWHRQPWFRGNPMRWIEKLPRASSRFPGMVAYYQTVQKRKAGILTPIKPGKFLKKYFGDLLTQEQIQELGMAWVAAYSPPELKVTQDADEIEQVYRGKYNGSCMWFGEGDWEGDCHPGRAYAGPDLGIAYIGEKEEADARCLIWPAKKIYYPKWYGDYHRLEMALEAEGWKPALAEDFAGARIQRIYNDDEGFYTVPYVDVCSYAHDDGEHLILGRGKVYCRQTNGTNEEAPRGHRYYCCGCEDRVHEDDVCTNDYGDHYCENCYEERFVECSITGHTVDRDNARTDPDGDWISDRAVQRGLAFDCDATGERYDARYHDCVVVGSETWEAEYAQSHAIYCEFSEEWVPDTSTKGETDDYRTFSWEAVDAYTARDFADWLGGARIIGRHDHPQQLDFDDALAVAA